MSSKGSIQEPGEKTPLIESAQVEEDLGDFGDEVGLSAPGVTLNLVKCCVGAGSFSIPYAFVVGLRCIVRGSGKSFIRCSALMDDTLLL
jgi:hypothetical protein